MRYSADQMEAAILAVNNGLSQSKASVKYDVPQRTLLSDRLNSRHLGNVGRPTVLDREIIPVYMRVFLFLKFSEITLILKTF